MLSDRLRPDSVGQYLKEVGRVHLLEDHEEIELGRKVQEWMGLEERRKTLEEVHGVLSDSAFCELAQIPEAFYMEARDKGLKARQHLVAANMRLAISVAKKHIMGKSSRDLQDLSQAAVEGLFRAAEKFNPELGYKFSTYAYWWIRQALTRNVPELENVIRLPVHAIEKMNRLDKLRKQLSLELGRKPTESELAAALKVPLERLRSLEEYARSPISLDMKVGESEDVSILDLQSSAVPDISESVDRGLLEQEISRILAELTDKERLILRYRFGFIDGRCWTLGEIGKLFNLSRERIRQLEGKAMRKLKSTEFQRKHPELKEFFRNV
jgi:RNA polymerase primary sigma factor